MQTKFLETTDTLPTAADRPGPGGVLQAFFDQLCRAPERVVGVHGQAVLTQAELAANAACLARAVADGQADRNEIVGVFAFPGLELLSGLWGVLFAGCAYCPLSPDYPEERLRYMIARSGMRVIVCETALKERLRGICDPGVKIVTLESAQTRSGTAHTLPAPDSEDLAYVIFTSGSTGKPKGVMIEHCAIASQMSWVAKTFLAEDAPIILQKTPFSFDAAQWELLASAYGAKLIFGDAQSYRDPAGQVALIQTHDVTHLQCVPTLWRALLETETLDRCSSLRWMFSGGEALPQSLAQDCLAALPRARLVNLYGPTECTINASSFELSRGQPLSEAHSVPIGRPVRDTDLRILDEDGTPVPPGEQGELYIGGAQLSRGYVGQPELTAERFVMPFGPEGGRYYRTGDIVLQNADGSFQFRCRADGQIKLRGHRIELDEIRSAVENHDWVKAAGIFVRPNPQTQSEDLIACVELSPNQAQLMDAGEAAAHHKTKTDKLQVKAQISQLGVMTEAELRGRLMTSLPGKDPSPEQERLAFARKSYRHFEGSDAPTFDELVALLSSGLPKVASDTAQPLDRDLLGRVLRTLGAFHSPDRLLPKYAYASPGALNPTQVFLEVRGVAGVEDGLHYYHPLAHRLHLMAPLPEPVGPALRVHFLGKRRAIAPVYRLNIEEVIDFEAGHILGLLDHALAPHGYVVTGHTRQSEIAAHLGADEGDHYLGAFALGTDVSVRWQGDAVTPYLQIHGDGVEGASPGLYRVAGHATWLGASQVEKKHVVAINQQVLERAVFGITLTVAGRGTLAYVALGRRLQHLQMNDLRYGFMSSGYSSRSGHDQRAATRIAELLGERPGAMYFCVGGRVSAEQQRHRGMKEDSVHTKGPTELIRDDLKRSLPSFMLPNVIQVVDRIPTSANGKVEIAAIQTLDGLAQPAPRCAVQPRNRIEAQVAECWRDVLKAGEISVHDDFFAVGGDSLSAVALIGKINAALSVRLPLEAIFDASTIAELATRLRRAVPTEASRLVRMHDGKGAPIFLWPGLGGYPMNLRLLARRLSVSGRPVYAIQAMGLNAGEVPLSSVTAMARADMGLIRRLQPCGPYTLIGYSFGARVAFGTAHQLEAAGHAVKNLVLVAPGNPRIDHLCHAPESAAPGFADPLYRAVLLSVFTQATRGRLVEHCMARITSTESFLDVVRGAVPGLDAAVTRRIFDVARSAFDTTYRFEELRKPVRAPVTVIKARNDDYAFIEGASGYTHRPPRIVQLPHEHFALLKHDGVGALSAEILRDVARDPARCVAA